jgi:excisionase family DNA binding protein
VGEANVIAIVIEDKPFFRVQEVARLFEVAPRTVWRWVSEGKLKMWRHGKVSRIIGASLQAFAQRGIAEASK